MPRLTGRGGGVKAPIAESSGYSQHCQVSAAASHSRHFMEQLLLSLRPCFTGMHLLPLIQSSRYMRSPLCRRVDFFSLRQQTPFPACLCRQARPLPPIKQFCSLPRAWNSHVHEETAFPKQKAEGCVISFPAQQSTTALVHCSQLSRIHAGES